MNLNGLAAQLCDSMERDAHLLGVGIRKLPCGARVIDCGVQSPGGLQAGLYLARICLADLADVAIAPGHPTGHPMIAVHTDHPVLACMASQYAGWEVKHDGFFAMGSGPMRAAAAREPLFEALNYRETATHCVGILETAKVPPDDVCRLIAEKCGIGAGELTLLVAPTRSLAGTVQVVARSVETALHKLHELKFDLQRIVSGYGTAPLPPPAADDLAAIGRTNDAVLYSGHAILYVRGDDQSLETIGRQLPSSASSDYGRPFAEILASYNQDFYQVDPMLFSPAVVTLNNVDTGKSFTYGQVNAAVLATSFAGA